MNFLRLEENSHLNEKRNNKNEMGQKTNPIIFRVGIRGKTWATNFFEKNKEESSLYAFHNIEIIKYINQYFNRYKILIHHLKTAYSINTIYIFLAYFVTKSSIIQIAKKNLVLLKTFKIQIQQQIQKIVKWKKITKDSNKNNFLLKKKVLNRIILLKKIKKILKRYSVLNKQHLHVTNFCARLLESLNLFTINNEIRITFQNLNKSLSLRLKFFQTISFKKTIFQLREYVRTSFFNETINILLITCSKKKSSKLIAEWIAFQLNILKKHNFFFIFLKRSLSLFLISKFSHIKGLKIIIKGRFNGAPRAKSKIIQTGKFSLQSFKSVIDYSQTVAYTRNGTFGVKVWIGEKV